MEGGGNGRAAEEMKAPLLESAVGRSGDSAHAARVPRKNSVTSMRGEFVSRLPDKVRHGVDMERPCTLDVSRTKDLVEGSVVLKQNSFILLIDYFFC